MLMEQEQSLEIYKVQPTTFKTNKQTNKGTNNSVKKEAFQQVMLGQLVIYIYIQKSEPQPKPHTLYKTLYKMDHRHKQNTENYKTFRTEKKSL